MLMEMVEMKLHQTWSNGLCIEANWKLNTINPKPSYHHMVYGNMTQLGSILIVYLG
jgi:hypothetical protein